MNHLPFILRSYLDVPWTPATTRRTQVKMPSLRFAGGEDSKIILQDLCVEPLYGGGGISPRAASQLLARIGIEGKGYLTEELIPLSVQSNSRMPQVPVWKFERPYRIDPGEGLKVKIIHRSVQAAASQEPNLTPAIMFHGKRVKDNLPIMLYDAKPTYLAAPSDDYGVVVNLTGSTLNCPADSSVLIYSVATYSRWTSYDLGEVTPWYPPLIQIFSPNGRPWSTSEIGTNNIFLGVAPAAANNWTVGEWCDGRAWIDPLQDRIELGEKRGWVLTTNENFLLELENPDTSVVQYSAYDSGGAADGYDLIVGVTLRGCLEVPNG